MPFQLNEESGGQVLMVSGSDAGALWEDIKSRQLLL